MKRTLKLVIIWFIAVIILLISGCRNNLKNVENLDSEYQDLKYSDTEYSDDYIGEVRKDVYINEMFQLKLNGKIHNMYVLGREELEGMKEYSDTDSTKAGKDKRNYINDMEALDRSGASRYVSIKIYRETEEKGMEKHIEAELQKQKKEYEGEYDNADVKLSTGILLDKEVQSIDIRLNGERIEYAESILYMKVDDYFIEIKVEGKDSKDIQEVLSMFVAPDYEEHVEPKYIFDVDANVKLSVGEVENGIYTNKMLNLKVDGKANDLRFRNDEEIKDKFGYNDSNRADIESVKEVLNKGDYFVDMHATTPDNKLAIAIFVYKSEYDLNTFLEKELNKLKKDFNASKKTIELFGEEIPGIEFEKIYYYETSTIELAFIKRGEYITVISSGGEYSSAPKDGFKLFEVLDNQVEFDSDETTDSSESINEWEEVDNNFEFSIGEINNGIYTNKMFGIRFDEKSLGMKIKSREEENNRFYSTDEKKWDIDEVLELLESGDRFVDMRADIENGGILVVMIKKEDMLKDLDSYINRQVVVLKDKYNMDGIYAEAKKGEAEFLGETGPYIIIHIKNMGRTYIKELYI
ncbi:putative lipoprotein [Lachnoanaerobaculum sp. MSX33]|uniref:hypothetical protein n=1 Tax=Lachnoanaerobaculum sp. MSX33 TaxID=936596 RepID=UPI0003DF9BE9|nr:hypothetical protein [Lachnoanaerobaculum sp. MSX33]ETO99229.1 putative lipoprotein [Lachnoanaerobaculum sp. MSX33]